MKSPRASHHNEGGKGGRTRGWKKASPKKGIARHEMKAHCPSCLLDPQGERYPICGPDCAPDCRGIHSAKVRSAQYHDTAIYNKAVKAQKKYHCEQGSTTRKRNSTRKSPRRSRK